MEVSTALYKQRKKNEGHWRIYVNLSKRKFWKKKRQKKDYGTPYIFPTKADAETWGETFRKCVIEESDGYEEAFYALMQKNETARQWIPEDKRTPISLDTTLNGNGSSIYSRNGGSVLADEGDPDQSEGESRLGRVMRRMSNRIFRTGATNQKHQRKGGEREKEEREKMEREKMEREKRMREERDSFLRAERLYRRSNENAIRELNEQHLKETHERLGKLLYHQRDRSEHELVYTHLEDGSVEFIMQRSRFEKSKPSDFLSDAQERRLAFIVASLIKYYTLKAKKIEEAIKNNAGECVAKPFAATVEMILTENNAIKAGGCDEKPRSVTAKTLSVWVKNFENYDGFEDDKRGKYARNTIQRFPHVQAEMKDFALSFVHDRGHFTVDLMHQKVNEILWRENEMEAAGEGVIETGEEDVTEEEEEREEQEESNIGENERDEENENEGGGRNVDQRESEEEQLYSRRLLPKKISKRTVYRWMQACDIKFVWASKTYYTDRHEDDDIIAKRNVYIAFMEGYRLRMHAWVPSHIV